jgi:hypothetical protein
MTTHKAKTPSRHHPVTSGVAIFFALIAGYCAIRSLHIDLMVFWFAVLAGAIAFGPATFNHLLDRLEFKASRAENVTETVTRTIQERRDPEKGFEAS